MNSQTKYFMRQIAMLGATLWIALICYAGQSYAADDLLLDTPKCDSDFGNFGGEFADVDLSNNDFVAGATVTLGELSDSAFVDVTSEFTPRISMPVNLSFGAVLFEGELVGFGGGNTIKATAKITVTLRDETMGVDIDSQVILDEEEKGSFGQQVINVINSGITPPLALFPNVDLVKGRTYSVSTRLDLQADGLGARADFSLSPNNFGCLVAESVLVDSDGDGIFDLWEQNGVDVDGNGTIDVDFPAMGADPMHKDLYYEMDWAPGFPPSRNDIVNIKETFAKAPMDAGGVNNPDGDDGINIWIDTGNATDPNASEDGAGLNTCSDGIDNGGDGTIDSADSDCLVGDNFGGGNALLNSVGALDDDFYTAKNSAQGFTPARRGLFRYAIQGDPIDGVAPFNGGRAEVGGDDLVVYNRLPGSLFHEIGHTLNLRHGGFESANCKPSYISVMNYHHQLGIRLTGASGGQDLDGDGVADGQILDFSPPRFAGGRGQAPLLTLDETDLDDGIILDVTDPFNQYSWVDPTGLLVRAPLNIETEWNNDNVVDLGQMIDVDIDGPSGCSGNVGLTANPPGLEGYDDWSNIRLPLWQSEDLADAAVDPVTQPELGQQELIELEEQYNTTDISVHKSDSPDPVEVGDPLSYTITVNNHGPNPASRVLLSDTLPANVTVLSLSPNCSEAGGALSCELGELLRGEQDSVQVQVDTSEVCEDGLPPVLSNTASVENLPKYPGPDLNLANNEITENTIVQDTTPPTIACNTPLTIIPPDAHITFMPTAEDLCDDDVLVEVEDFDCFKFTNKGKKIDKTNSCVVQLSGDSATVLDSGGVNDHIQLMVKATDSSGNVSQETCEILVIKP